MILSEGLTEIWTISSFQNMIHWQSLVNMRKGPYPITDPEPEIKNLNVLAFLNFKKNNVLPFLNVVYLSVLELIFNKYFISA